MQKKTTHTAGVFFFFPAGNIHTYSTKISLNGYFSSIVFLSALKQDLTHNTTANDKYARGGFHDTKEKEAEHKSW